MAAQSALAMTEKKFGKSPGPTDSRLACPSAVLAVT